MVSYIVLQENSSLRNCLQGTVNDQSVTLNTQLLLYSEAKGSVTHFGWDL